MCLEEKEGVREGVVVGVKEREEQSSRSSVFAFSDTGMEKDWRILQQTIKQGLQVDPGKSTILIYSRPSLIRIALDLSEFRLLKVQD